MNWMKQRRLSGEIGSTETMAPTEKCSTLSDLLTLTGLMINVPVMGV